MLSIYLVDDEIMSIEYFKSIFANTQCGEYTKIAGSNTNPLNALSEIEQLRPDVVFVDVVMPSLNGLELSEKILSLRPVTKIVLLTAHRDFSYAKTSFRLGVFDYLLKHEISEHSLETILRKLDKVLEKEKNNRSLNLREYLKGLILTGSAASPSQEEEQEFQKMCSNCILLDIIEDCPVLIGMDSALLEEEIWEDIPPDRISIAVRKDAVFTQIKEGRWLCLLPFYNLNSSLEIQQASYETARRIQEAFAACGRKVSCIISQRCCGVKAVGAEYKRLHQCRKRVFFNGFCSIRYSQEFRFPTIMVPDIALKEIPQFLSTRQYDKAEDVIEKVLARAENFSSFSSYNGMVNEIAASIVYYAQQSNIPLNKELQQASLESTDEVRGFFENQMKFIKKANEVSQYSKTINQCLNHINANYCKDLSSQYLARLCGISERYLRRLFKEEIGTTPTQYITNLRIEKAKEILLLPDSKPSNVYAQVGFASNNYFISVFKKRVGATPARFSGREN